MTDNVILQCDHLKFSYSDFELEASFEVSKGDIVAVTGKSGAGKSTLFALISGFLQPESGQIYIQGENMQDKEPAERHLNLLFQENNLFEHLKVWQNIGLGLKPNLKLSDEEKNSIKLVLGDMGLNEKYDAYPHELSGGQRQRVALARVLMRKKSLLLLDEGFTGVDEETKEGLMGLIEKMRDENQLTVLFITHHQDEIARLATKTIHMTDGKASIR